MAWLLTVVELEAHARFESFRGSSTWLITVSAFERDISQSVSDKLCRRNLLLQKSAEARCRLQVDAFLSVDRQFF
jgi:hypothetical protein